MSAEPTWRPVPGYEGQYEVSDDGRVRSLPRLDSLGRPNSCGGILKSALRSGYPSVTLYSAGKVNRRSAHVHSLVAAAFIGPRPLGQEVRHLDGNPMNNHAGNLAYGTKSQNRYDAVRHGTHDPHRGESSGAAKLNADNVRNIRQLWAEGVSQRAIAADHHVHRSTVSLIVNRKTWRHAS